MSHSNGHVLKFDGDGVKAPEVFQTEVDNKIVVVWTPPTPPIAGDTYRIAVTGTAADFPVSVGTVIGTKVVWVSGVVKAVPGKATVEMKHVGGSSCEVELQLEPVKKGVSNTTFVVIAVALVAVFCLGCSLAGLAGLNELYQYWFSPEPVPPVVVTEEKEPTPSPAPVEEEEETKPEPKPEEVEESPVVVFPTPDPVPVDVKLVCTVDLRKCGNEERTLDDIVCCWPHDLSSGPELYQVKGKVNGRDGWQHGELERVYLHVTFQNPDAPIVPTPVPAP